MNGMLFLILILALFSAIAFLIPTYQPREKISSEVKKSTGNDIVMREFDRIRRRLK